MRRKDGETNLKVKGSEVMFLSSNNLRASPTLLSFLTFEISLRSCFVLY